MEEKRNNRSSSDILLEEILKETEKPSGDNISGKNNSEFSDNNKHDDNDLNTDFKLSDIDNNIDIKNNNNFKSDFNSNIDSDDDIDIRTDSKLSDDDFDRNENIEKTTTFNKKNIDNNSGRVAVINKNSHIEDELYDDLEGISQVKAQVNNNSSKKRKKNHKRNRVLSSIIVTFLIIVISVGIASVIITYGRDLLGINSSSTTKMVAIPQGADTAQIAEILKEEDIITHPKLFTFFAGLSNKDANFTAGEHELRPDMAYETIFEELASPALTDSNSVQITFQEGITLCEAADILEQSDVCSAKEFLNFFNNNASYDYLYENYLPSFTNEKFYKMEGYLFPDTYSFYVDMDVDLVCQKILKNFNEKISAEYYTRMEELDISLDEMLTLASMIQCEAGTVEQMPKISSVFWNRLNNPTAFPKLQSDPTTGYVDDVIKPHIDSVNQEMFDGYDTYICDGLPSGPICNPGLDAIRAALYPASTEYYFFYSNLNTRETYFSRTLQEHEAWIKKVEGHNYVSTSSPDGESGTKQTTTKVIYGVGGGNVSTTSNNDNAGDDNDNNDYNDYGDDLYNEDGEPY